MSAATISASKVNQARRALGYAEMAKNAESAVKMGKSAQKAAKGEGSETATENEKEAPSLVA